jgi:hypothetical protein
MYIFNIFGIDLKRLNPIYNLIIIIIHLKNTMDNRLIKIYTLIYYINRFKLFKMYRLNR